MMDPARLKEAIHQLTLTELIARFGSFKNGLLPAEQAGFDEAMDKLAEAVGFGDGPETVTEITSFGKVKVGIDVSPSTFKTITQGDIE